MPSTGILVIIALLLAIIALLVALLVSQRRTRIAAEEAAERVIPDQKQELERLLQQVRGGIVEIADRSARTAMQDLGLDVMAALGYVPAAPHQLATAPYGSDGDYHEHDGFAAQRAGWATEAPVDNFPGQDHPGARNQMALRSGRPLSVSDRTHGEPDGRVIMDGYEQVVTGYQGDLVVTDSRRPGGGNQPAYATVPPPGPGDTASLSAIGPNGEPAEFSATNFQRRPGESEQDYKERVHGENGLQARYERWLAEQLEVTGSFPRGLGQTAAARDALAVVTARN